MARATSKPASDVVCLLVGMTSVAYRHGVKSVPKLRQVGCNVK